MQRIMPVKNIAIFILIFVCNQGYSQLGGERGFTFLQIPSSARTSAMGGSSAGIKDNDINLMFDNPAQLDTSLDNHLSVNYINYISDINAGTIGYVKQVKKGAVGIGTQFLGYGKFDQVAANGNKTGETFRAGDFALNLSYGRALDSVLWVGGGLKTIYSSYFTRQQVALALDLGAAYWSKNRLYSATFVIKNLGRSLTKFDDGSRSKLPFNIEIGGAVKVPKAPLRFFTQYQHIEKWDLGSQDPNYKAKEKIDPETGLLKKRVFTTDNLFRHIVIGSELVFGENFYITLAYNFRRRKELASLNRGTLSGFSFGTSFKVKRLHFSYALGAYTASGIAHHIGISTNLNNYF